MTKYDYIFIGAGCAGLSLLTRMVAAGLTKDKRILVIDKSRKQENDRTWCFWETDPGFFEPIVYRQWKQVWFHANSFSKQLDMGAYSYKMIRGIDFYHHCQQSIATQQRIDFIYGELSDWQSEADCIKATIDGQMYTFSSPAVFNSAWKEDKVRNEKKVYLLQHFKGWIVETTKPFFNPAAATIMDFRVDQQHGTSFVYVLPVSATKALVEYTLFSDKLLPDDEYTSGLSGYMADQLQLTDYKVTAEEFGVIPMTDASFPWYANGMYHIGTAGGQTKASSGYTFQFIQKQSAAIVEQLKAAGLSPLHQPAAAPNRFHFYDAVLLRVLDNQYATGSKVFSQLFRKNQAHKIFSFLDNSSSLTQDLSIIASLPTWPFLKAAIKIIG